MYFVQIYIPKDFKILYIPVIWKQKNDRMENNVQYKI